MRWSYGVTTVPVRQHTLLPRTLTSLARAGFDRPRLFIDDCPTKLARDYEDRYGLPVTSRFPRIHTYMNWTLALAELYGREPTADRYAVFQDDFVTYRRLRDYLDRSPYPEGGYLNLYTFPDQQARIPQGHVGWHRSSQHGRGAVALVFSRQAVKALLSHQHMVERPEDTHRGTRSVDGGLVTAAKKAGWTEYVHSPSLVQHTGYVTTMGSRRHPDAPQFWGEDYDATGLLELASGV